ncbi:MAG: CoA transferase [Pseudomonadales bacterium]|nr:CoA transferase [Pseudomonadales bacterium]MBO6566437.1 CoA transferase [Pseudomonadales bacterium]MBO6595792.1 CoA transferase [Pseudomonadales bacterium]MBO6822276.1 CoA transferase [Pseudomonadales bacterium]
MAAAFEGIRILDFTQVLAGPFAVMQLALLGAEVIKVEQPLTGDQTRGLMNKGEDIGMSPSFMGMNLNKKSLTLNLRAPEAANVIKKLLPSIDVVVENFKAGTMQRRGLDYETLRELKPDLIYCSLSGYGQTGSRAGEAAYDGAIQASSGMMSQNGHEETGPTRTGYMPVDMSTALNTAFAISASLHRKAKTGKGQFIDVAMLDTAVVMQAAQFSNYMNQGQLVGLRGNASPTGQPTANVFPTKDGHIQITALRQPQVEKLFAELGLSDMLEEEKYATPEARVSQKEPIFAAVSRGLADKTTAEWMEQLASQGIPVAEVRDLPEVSQDEDLAARKVFISLPSPVTEDETIRVVKAGYVTNEDGPFVHSGPPLLGAHTKEILRDLGYDDEHLNELSNKGVI